MVVSDNFNIPSDADLTVDEVNLPYPVLHGASVFVGKYCENHNLEYIQCKQEEQDPRRCLQEGKQVTACALDFFRKLKKNCMEEFNQYVDCLDYNAGEFHFKECREAQAPLDQCVLSKMGIERPSIGYFCEAKVHDSSRPKPEWKEDFSDRPTARDPNTPLYPSKWGGHYYYQ